MMDPNDTLNALGGQADDIARRMKRLMSDQHLRGEDHQQEIARLQGALEVTVLFIRGVRMGLWIPD